MHYELALTFGATGFKCIPLPIECFPVPRGQISVTAVAGKASQGLLCIRVGETSISVLLAKSCVGSQ